MPVLTRQAYLSTLAVFLLLAALTLAVAPLVGAVALAPRTLLGMGGDGTGRSEALHILLAIRLPRVILAFLAGGALALTGAAFQALLRNPLATPYTLGVANGGALGAVVCLFLPQLAQRFQWEPVARAAEAFLRGWGPVGGMQIASLAASGAVAWIILGLASRPGRPVSMTGLLLAGVTIGLICSAMIMLVRYLSAPRLAVRMDRWLMGGLDVDGWRSVWATLPLLGAGVVLLLGQARKFDQLAYGEEMAAGRGVDVARLQRTAFFAGSLLTAAVVSVAGPIGFVGLIIPHAMRRMVGADHRLLMPVAFLAGGIFLTVCDTFARTAFAPVELPVGVITALLGGPFFLTLLLRRLERF